MHTFDGPSRKTKKKNKIKNGVHDPGTFSDAVAMADSAGLSCMFISCNKVYGDVPLMTSNPPTALAMADRHLHVGHFISG